MNKFELTFAIEAVDGTATDNIIISLVVDGQAVAWDKRVFEASDRLSPRKGQIIWLTLDGRRLTMPVALRAGKPYRKLTREQSIAWFRGMRYRPAPVQAVA
jgi:hypothetical protein